MTHCLVNRQAEKLQKYNGYGTSFFWSSYLIQHEKSHSAEKCVHVMKVEITVGMIWPLLNMKMPPGIKPTGGTNAGGLQLEFPSCTRNMKMPPGIKTTGGTNAGRSLAGVPIIHKKIHR